MADDARPQTIPDALARAARLFPDVTAYVEAGESVTWRELESRSRDAAAGLIAMGVRAGDRVAISAENSIEWLTTLHALSRIGAIAVLVYYDLRERELQEQIGRPESRVLFASPAVLARLGAPPPCVEHAIVLNDSSFESTNNLARLAALATDESKAQVDAHRPSPADLAAIIYTSGTTGGAKGVMLSHGNFLSNANAAATALTFDATDSVLLVLPLHHAMPVIATVVIVAVVGAKTVIENDLRRVRDRLQEHRPTIFFGVPALYEIIYRNVLARAESEGRLQTLLHMQKALVLLKRVTGLNLGHIVFKKVHVALGGKLRFLVSGGAALSPATARAYFSLGLPLLQGWGMTEASPVVAVQRFSRARFRYTRYYENHIGSVGPALPGVEVRLVDVPDKDVYVDRGGEGEVLVRGPNVFQGYWEAPDATAEAIRDGWLHTGDLGRIDADGNIYLTGRSKYIVVLDSGEKVHPEELEDLFATSELIEDVCVTSRRVRDKVVVAAIVYPRLEALHARLGGESATETDVRALISSEVDRLCRELASYKRVTAIELTDEPLPKTALRKVARGQLREAYAFDIARWIASSEESAATPV